MRKKQSIFRRRRIFGLFFIATIAIAAILANPDFWQTSKPNSNKKSDFQTSLNDLNSLEVKGRSPKTGYSREQFGKGWAKDSSGCDTRNRILKRDLINVVENSDCKILSGTLKDPYTGKEINFSRKQNASAVQIDHIVALSDAWQKGAQQFSKEKRIEFANDPLNLLASDGPANQQKGDSDAASWLPSNKDFRCEYISRQVSIKKKYSIWVTASEKSAMQNILQNC